MTPRGPPGGPHPRCQFGRASPDWNPAFWGPPGIDSGGFVGVFRGPPGGPWSCLVDSLDHVISVPGGWETAGRLEAPEGSDAFGAL